MTDPIKHAREMTPAEFRKAKQEASLKAGADAVAKKRAREIETLAAKPRKYSK